MGVGVSRDAKQGIDYLRRAAEGGEANAQTALATSFSDGNDVPQDRITALAWATLGAQNGSQAAAAIKERVAKELIPKELEDAKVLMQRLKQRTTVAVEN
jgi:TPR repeat protein